MSKITCFIVLIFGLVLAGCSEKVQQEKQAFQTPTESETVAKKAQEAASTELVEEAALAEEVNKAQLKEIDYKMIETDFNVEMDAITLSNVILNPARGELWVDDEALAKEQLSPYSTFKIVSALMGLEEGVLTSLDSTMNYDGTIYPIESWNSDLTLKDAMKNSCVWYFRKVINQIGQQKVQAYLNELNYGNQDISQWSGSGLNASEAIDGFWLGSSLKISPVEQVMVLAEIFQGETDFSKQNVELVKEALFCETINGYKVYGKTGTGNEEAWFVGLFENEENTYYFATRLTGSETHKVAGNMAKKVIFSIIEKFNED